jgi:hypothetical protein
MKRIVVLLVLTGAVLPACYHATIDTGLTPGTQVVGDQWANSWVLGLVPPDVMDAGAECANGVARVETQLSFLNQLVSFITFGIYTPMQIDVTCAAGGGGDADLTVVTSEDEWENAVRSGEPFLVTF